ncbi:unnamed protein product [Parnassius apollo]|uniref:(apollo) hypothetical protein n=1 Tax=Parnassius apollo TaxID=110799 RepID=A0A8S3X5R0_PARAO|nr:unnamed protein product [Parnassius apollo]
MGYFILLLTVVLLRSMIVTVTGSTITEARPPPRVDDFGPTCEMIDGTVGVCVPNYQCNPETNAIDKNTFVDLRIGTCPHYMQVCCLNSEVAKPSEPKEKLPMGSENIGTADFGEFPWMVAILRNTAPDVDWSQEDYLGGGSIIHPSVVITAAHKVDGLLENEVKCRAGEWDTQEDSELYSSQERRVKKIVTHDDFFRLQAYYNVALLFLEKPFTFRDSPQIGVGCLGKTIPAPGTMCFTMGWGKDFNGKYATTLKKIKLPLIESDKCQHSLRNTRLGSRFLLHPSLICAGGEAGVDTCKGDGGSPLVCSIEDPKKDTRFAIFGIVSSGIGCGRSDVPGVYVNVPYIYDWVVEQMNEEKLDKTSFTY